MKRLQSVWVGPLFEKAATDGGLVRRRHFFSFFGGAAITWPLLARAQQPTTQVIGFLHYGSPADSGGLAARFREGLAASGFIEGGNVTIEYRWAEGRSSQVPSLAVDLVHREVTVIFAAGPQIALAVKTAAAGIPTVFTSGDDPVRLGLVASLNRPGGNITGVYIFASELETKRLGVLHEMVPRASDIGVLGNPISQQFTTQVAEVQSAARVLGLTLHIQKASTEPDFDPAFASFAKEQASALIVLADPFFFSRRERLIALAARYTLPAIYELGEFAMAGGLMAYGVDIGDSYRLAGEYVGRILKGEKPADLPVVQATKFQFVINLKTARSLGLDVPQSLLAQADEVIE